MMPAYFSIFFNGISRGFFDTIIYTSFGDAGDCVERTCSVKNLRDSAGGVVTGHDGSHTTLSLSFASDDPVKSISSHSASGTFPLDARTENHGESELMLGCHNVTSM